MKLTAPLSLLLCGSSAFRMELEQRHDHPLVQVGYSTAQTNYQDTQYYGNLYIGSAKQLMTVVFDTGKQDCWLPLNTCNAGECTNTLYDQTLSTTYGVGSTVDTQTYNGLTATGTWVNDQFCLRSTSRCTAQTFSFLGVTEATDYAANI